ncbi:flagellar basal-body MS-ring/collar protein FliF [Thiohalorhabdus methylotrophus]|uniref:Flagellar M-ring protein n=1 Tax=Thiohalorhabdus methylotrophus TaxID=3242694 RepID=A0ABV4TX18_9GAMM
MANGTLSSTGRSLRETLSAIPREKQVAIAALGLLLLAGFAGLIYWAQKAEYAVLYSQLGQKNAGNVVEALEQQGVPYKLVNGGTMIQVPADQVSRLRLSLAKSGVPDAGRKGYSLFDNRDVVGMSSFAQKLNFKRALEGELERTINGLGVVEKSRVHLVTPEKALFEKDQKPAKASVALQLANGNSLDQETVDGVVHLVAAGVEGLKPEQVTVVDQNGRVLNGEDDPKQKTGPGDELVAYKRNLENNLQKQLTSLVERVVGPGRAVVRVNTDINDKKVQLHEESYDPFSKVPRSKQTRSRTGGSAGGVGGEAGAAANVPSSEEEGPQQGSGSGGVRVREETVNYEISKTVRDVLKPGGGIERLSVAVLVDGSYETVDGNRQFVPRDQEQLDSLRSLVADAAGINQGRGDSVTVESMPLHAPEQAQGAVGELTWWDIGMEGARYGGYVLVTFLILWFVGRPLMRYLTEPTLRRAESSAELEEGGGSGQALSNALGGWDEERRELESRRSEIEERAATEQERREQVRDVVRKEEENSVAVVRQWLRE